MGGAGQGSRSQELWVEYNRWLSEHPPSWVRFSDIALERPNAQPWTGPHVEIQILHEAVD
jgi:hypothetical protein